MKIVKTNPDGSQITFESDDTIEIMGVLNWLDAPKVEDLLKPHLATNGAAASTSGDMEVVEAAELDEDSPPPSLHIVSPTSTTATPIPVTWRERQVIEVLRRHPDGIASADIAQRLNKTKAAINGHLGGLGPLDPRKRGLAERVPGRWLWRLTTFGKTAQLFECSVPGHVYGFTYGQK